MSAIRLNSMTNYAVILAGGKGERLWPLSREKQPKQLLPFVNHNSLLEDTLNRLNELISQKNRFLITTQQQKEIINNHVGNIVGTILVEPVARNTAPAILLSCLMLAQQDSDAVVIFLPADPYIPDTKKFVHTVSQALEYSQTHDDIILLGVKPRFPATGYGYIEFQPDAQDNCIGSVIKFHEKPSLETAKKYCSMQSMLWNIGIFCAKVSVFLQQFQKYAPEMYATMENYIQSGDQSFYAALPSISIDYAIMEKSDAVKVVPVDFEWSDVGNLDIFLTLQQAARPDKQQEHIEIESHNNLISGPAGKLIALVGVHDLCIVETPDALLVMKRSEAEKVKSVVEALKKKNLDRYL